MSQTLAPMELLEEIPIKGAPDPARIPFHSIVASAGGGFYISDEFNHRIIVLSPAGEFIRYIGEKGAGPGQFWYPRGLAIVQNGPVSELVVCDGWNHRIQRFDMDGNFIAASGSIGDGDGQFDEPVGVIADGSAIWVLDRCNHRVKKHSLDGRLITQFGKRLGVADEEAMNDPAETVLGNAPAVRGLKFPMGFARLSSGDFVIADTGNRRVIKFGPDGTATGLIKLDVNGKPPYTYPLAVAALGEDLFLIKSLNSAFRVADTSGMWISDETCLNGAIINTSAFSAYKGANGETQLVIADGEKGIIRRYRLSITPGASRNPAPQAFPGDGEFADTPNNWTESGCGRWLSYLAASASGAETLSKAKTFLATAKKSAVAAATKLNTIEGEMFQALVRRYDLMDEWRAGKKKGGGSDDPAKLANWERVQYKASQQTRIALRHALAGDLNGICDVLTGKDSEALAPERAGFLELFNSEYAQRRKDYTDVAQYLRERLSSPQNVNPQAALHAFAVILFLRDHISLMSKAIGRLDAAFKADGLEDEKTLRPRLEPFRPDQTELVNKVLTLIAQISEEWGHYQTARMVYRHGIESGTSGERHWYAISMFDLMFRHGEGNEALGAALAPAVKEVQDQLNARELVKRLQICGAIATADELINKFAPQVASDPAAKKEWDNLGRTQRALMETKDRSVTLSIGQSVAEALKSAGKEPPPAGAGLRYVTSLSLVHPDTGAPLHPYKAKMAPGFGILVADINGALFLIAPDRAGLKPVFAEPGFSIGDVELVNQREALLTLVADKPPYKSGGVRLLNLETGHARDYTGEIKCQLPETPFRLTSNNSSGFVMTGLMGEKSGGQNVWLADRDFTKSEPVAAPDGQISDISHHEGELALTYWMENLIHSVNLKTGDTRIIQSRLSVTPSGVAHDDSGLLYVTNARGIGMQVYGPHGDLVYQITSLKQGATAKHIHCGYLSGKRGYTFAGGDLALTDRSNAQLHIFKTESYA
ncbi:MAG: NHL repeat-containing protein [Nitrospinae bacterium]|nr:NHL repeat-containing protein [Nitrospinota bacterium]